MSTKTSIYQMIPVIIVSIFIVAGIVLAWTEPTAPPPQNNVWAPLNVSSIGQSKVGGLILNTGGAVTGLIVDKGNVGIGTQTPSQKLDVVGIIQALGFKMPTDAGAGKVLTSDADGNGTWQAISAGGAGGGTGGWYVPTSIKATNKSLDMNNEIGQQMANRVYKNSYHALYDFIQKRGCAGYHVCEYQEVVRFLELNDNIFDPTLHGWMLGEGITIYGSPASVNDCHEWKHDSGTGVALISILSRRERTFPPIIKAGICHDTAFTGEIDGLPVLCCR